MKIVTEKTITDIKNIKAAGFISGLKKSGKKDFAIIYSEKEAVAAATFTKNKVKAAPVLMDMEHIKSENTQAIVINSGNANACNGAQGLEDAKTMAKEAATILNLKPEEVLVSSTGRIGVPMPMDIIKAGIVKGCAELSYQGGGDAAEAIMTTDTFPKSIFVETEIGGKVVSIGAIAKGSGMIHPDMGTMLGFIVTDVNISKELLSKALKATVNDSYNMVSVDGDTSTNDTVIVLANGAAENTKITEENEDYLKFKEALEFVNKDLAKKIAKDGEGATRLIQCEIHNAASDLDARTCAKSVITSSLVKAAFFGGDANWGRIMCSLGYSGANLDPNKIDIGFVDGDRVVKIVENGFETNFDKEEVHQIILRDEVYIDIDLKDGKAGAVAWGCDLTYGYVEINGTYEL
ncbi:bifunctional glutamate N-acetyltransferase/amino-acid acetyltransferase ArgJ [Clostridium cellulovorans]|uniref:Arginine biosynthesis bifunctional protein ArgJ n=1 Tax=Clostridium cellulovorans (strain ATCC 35296 / DSM 3052 / OCM 3 / 743B) TaxID=573061 RepID=D9SLS1_CLOC7|nr:bifunctional glutamate N-acetyltransferase/amino-acid acetyltransferase ArgJ [Clostridium cellulovorans]ADL53708.1 arginine biosynthesis bifunctional protein ArgJ [Clostridium cellulovorans 743B]